MESRIPLPTDNLYKFYALFGLFLVIFGIGAAIYVNKSTNDLIFEIIVEYETLEADSARSVSQETHYQLLEKKLEIAISNKRFSLFFLGVVIATGSIMIWNGFKKWHTEIQPIQDEIARLTLEKLKRELNQDDDKV